MDDLESGRDPPLVPSKVFQGLSQIPGPDKPFSSAEHGPTPATEAHDPPHIPPNVTNLRPLVTDPTSEGNCRIHNSDADSASPHEKVGQSRHSGTPKSPSHAEHHNTFQVSEIRPFGRNSGEADRHTSSPRPNTTEVVNSGVFATECPASQAEVEYRDRYQSHESRQRSINGNDRPHDQILISEAAADNNPLSYPDRMRNSPTPTETSERGKEIDPKEVGSAIQYFHISHNTSSAFSVKLRDTAIESWSTARPWILLESLEFVQWNGITCRKGDVVYIRTGAEEKAVDFSR